MGIDWNSSEDELYARSVRAIYQMAQEYPNEVFSFFAYRANYYYGLVSLAFDTIQNGLKTAREHHDRTVPRHAGWFGHPRAWDSARYYVSHAAYRIVDYSPRAGEFKYPDFHSVNFKSWEETFRGEDLPESEASQGHVIVLLARVIDRLVDAGVFSSLQQAPLFRVGFEFEDDDLGLVVMRMLNWPEHLASGDHR